MRRTVERRPVVLASAGLLFLGVFAWRQLAPDPYNELALLYVMPIALVALELGARGGVAAAALALLLAGVGLAGARTGTDALGLVARAAAFLAVGGMAGWFSDRMQDGQRRYRQLVESGLTLAHMDAEGDVPRALVDQARDLVPSFGASVELSDGRVLASGKTDATRCTEAFPVTLRGRGYGTLHIDPRRPLAPEDRAALAILGLQAAVAAENRQLLDAERERAVIEGELRDAQLRLAERSGQLRALMARQEMERGELSNELHDDAAQVLSAVLMGLKALELQRGREDGRAGVTGESWELLRSDIESTLQLLRTLAVNLRPPVLRLGLRAALEDLEENMCADGECAFEIDLDDELGLDPDVETAVYRIVEEVVQVLQPPRYVRVQHTGAGALVIEARSSGHELDNDRLRILTARAELLGGHLSVSPTELRIVIASPAVGRAARRSVAPIG